MSSEMILSQYLTNQLERLVVLREYQQTTDDAYVKSALALLIEDTHEAIARVSSRLRRLGVVTAPLSDEATETAAEKLLRQARGQRSTAAKILFVWHGLKHQMAWYQTHLKSLRQDADTQAILVALAEQTRLRLERWESLMAEMKVSAEK